MPKPYKVSRPYPLPNGADLVEVDGRVHARMKERGRAVHYRVSKDGTKYLKPSKRWYFDLRDGNGIVRRVKGFADLKATEQLAAELERKASRVRSGFIDPAEEHARRPLAEHLIDYAAAMEAKGNTPEHNRATVSKISAMLNGCGFVFAADMDAGKVSAWLADLRRPKPIRAIPAGDAFSSSAVAELLGISADAVRRFVSRHRLPTEGQGPARRLPRTSVARIAEQTAKGCGPETVNHYVRAVRGFLAWLVKAKRIGSNPLDSLSLVNSAMDVRRGRRELTAEELGKLFVAARDSLRSFRGLTGRDRYFLYLVAAGTGFRANALANLTPADFDLAAPSVRLVARFNKSRKLKIQPLPVDIANALRDFLSQRPANAPVWRGTWASGCAGAEMIRRDLDAAGIPYAVEGPEGPAYADFHALRHSFLTLGGRSGIDLRTLQELAGHSTPNLTARYSHRRLYDLAGAVDKLPNLVPTAAEIPLRQTGTEGEKSVVPGVVTGGAGRHFSASNGIRPAVCNASADSTQPLEITGAGADSHRPARIRVKLPGLDSNQDKESQNRLADFTALLANRWENVRN